MVKVIDIDLDLLVTRRVDGGGRVLRHNVDDAVELFGRELVGVGHERLFQLEGDLLGPRGVERATVARLTQQI